MFSKKIHLGIWLLFLYSVVILLVVAPVMRESDQASLLSGSLQLARDGEIFGRSFYNYSRQYGSYWLLALVFRIGGLSEIGSNLDSVVFWGNLTAAVIFLSGLWCLFLVRRPQSKYEGGLLLAVLLSPVVLFSAPLLASNLVSGGFILLLAAVASQQTSRQNTILAGVLSFAAVGARADAVLVLPAIVFLSLSKLSILEVFWNPRTWMMFGCSVLALVVGSLIGNSAVANYDAFFQPLVFASFLSFGLGSSVFLLVGAVVFLSWTGVKKRDWQRLLVAVSLCLPLVFYGRILFTPRHLLTTALVLLVFLFFDSSRSWLKELVGLKVGRILLLIVLLGAILNLFVGVRLDSMKSGKAVVSQPTLFPSADGLWPMGCQAQFLWWLSQARELPLDHNQRVWAAWVEMSKLSPQVNDVEIRSHGLLSLGKLKLVSLGQDKLVSDKAAVIISDDRSFTKEKTSVAPGEGRRFAEEERHWRTIASSEWNSLLCSGGTGTEEGETKLAILKELQARGERDDLIVARKDASWRELRGGGPFRWLVFEVSLGQSGPEVQLRAELSGGQELGAEAWSNVGEAEIWLARSALPQFFRVSNYQR